MSWRAFFVPSGPRTHCRGGLFSSEGCGLAITISSNKAVVLIQPCERTDLTLLTQGEPPGGTAFDFLSHGDGGSHRKWRCLRKHTRSVFVCHSHQRR